MDLCVPSFKENSALGPVETQMKKIDYDAFLLVSFGGPNQPDEVMPFLENVKEHATPISGGELRSRGWD